MELQYRLCASEKDCRDTARVRIDVDGTGKPIIIPPDAVLTWETFRAVCVNCGRGYCIKRDSPFGRQIEAHNA